MRALKLAILTEMILLGDLTERTSSDPDKATVHKKRAALHHLELPEALEM